MEALPLDGVRVLDLTQALAGPFGSMILGDLGAEVIKVEPPAGDVTRTTPPYYVSDTSIYFVANNRNKKSVILDLKKRDALEAFYELVEVSDVVFYNFSAGVAERLGIDAANLEKRNPRIITCNVTGFGRSGAGANRRAVDLIIQSLSGAMSITGEPGGEPVRAGIATGDLSTGLYAVIGILSALHTREKTDEGSRVETSLFHSQISLLNYVATYCLFSGDIPERVGSGHPGTVPSQTFATSDGWVTIDAGFDRHFVALCDVLECPHLATDPLYANRRSRSENRGTLLPILQEKIRNASSSFWIERLNAARIPCAPVNNVREALDDAQSVTYRAVREVSYGGSEVPVLATPLWFNDRVEHALREAPKLGAHTNEVLQEILDYDTEQIEAVLGTMR